jgi:hypothetical protein
MAVVKFEELRSLAFGSISGTYAELGDPLENQARLIKISNFTDAPLLLSIDRVEDHDFIAPKSFALYDVQANKNDVHEDDYVFGVGTQFYIKQVSAPSEGSVYLTAMGKR